MKGLSLRSFLSISLKDSMFLTVSILSLRPTSKRLQSRKSHVPRRSIVSGDEYGTEAWYSTMSMVQRHEYGSEAYTFR